MGNKAKHNKRRYACIPLLLCMYVSNFIDNLNWIKGTKGNREAVSYR